MEGACSSVVETMVVVGVSVPIIVENPTLDRVEIIVEVETIDIGPIVTLIRGLEIS